MRSPLRLEVLEDRAVPALLLTAGADPSQLVVTASSEAGPLVTVIVTADPAWVGQVLSTLQASVADLDALFVAAATSPTGPTLIDPSAPPPVPDPSNPWAGLDPTVAAVLGALLDPLTQPYGDLIRTWN